VGEGAKKEEEKRKERGEKHTVVVSRLSLSTVATLNTIDGIAINDLLRGEIHSTGGGVSLENPGRLNSYR
jgi:hypothetical protein